MILWNQQSQAMLQACSIKRGWRFLLAGIFSLSVISCSSQKIQSISLGEWIQVLNEKAGIYSYTEQIPYFLNVPADSEYFDAVQAAAEWSVLDSNIAFDPAQELNHEWTASTLMNLIGSNQKGTAEIKDISSSLFLQQIQAAVSCGLMHTDSRNLFHPQQIIDQDEAESMLEKAVTWINHREIQTSSKINWKEDIQLIDTEPISINTDHTEAILPIGTEVSVGSILQYIDPDSGIQEYQKVVAYNDQEEGIEAILIPADLLEYTEDIDISGNTDIDFSAAKITAGDSSIIQEESDPSSPDTMSTHPYQKSFHVGDFTVVLRATSGGVNAEINKDLPYGSELYAAVKVNGVKADYQFLSEEKSIKDAYFKVSFKSEEDLGLKNSGYKQLYGDFSKINSSDFVSTLKNLYQSKNDALEKTLTIASITVPLPGSPIVNLTMNLDLSMSISGKVQLSLVQNNELGCEVRNGNMRMIKECKNTCDNKFQASARLTAGIRFALNLTAMDICDISLNAGARATLKTTVHLYDAQGKRTLVSTDLPMDVTDEMSDENPSVLVCGDINAYWILNVKVNSSKSLLGKLGISNTISLLKSDNNSLLPNGKVHLENFQFVDHCTRGDHFTSTSDTFTVYEKITLKNYSMAVHISETKTLEILGVPSNIKKEDLLYTSSNTDVAQVDQDGNVTGIASGSAVIAVYSADGTQKAECSILVPEKNV